MVNFVVATAVQAIAMHQQCMEDLKRAMGDLEEVVIIYKIDSTYVVHSVFLLSD
jgi:hypothetical protein